MVLPLSWMLPIAWRHNAHKAPRDEQPCMGLALVQMMDGCWRQQKHISYTDTFTNINGYFIIVPQCVLETNIIGLQNKMDKSDITDGPIGWYCFTLLHLHIQFELQKKMIWLFLIITPRDELIARPQWVTQSVTHQLWRDTQRFLSSDVNYVGELETEIENKLNQWKLFILAACSIVVIYTVKTSVKACNSDSIN